MAYTPTTWVDDDGSGTTGTSVTAARMNNIEAGVDSADAALAGKAPQDDPTFTTEVTVSDAAGGKFTMVDPDSGVNLKISRWWNSAGSTYLWLGNDDGLTKQYPVRIYHDTGRVDFDASAPVPTHGNVPLAKTSDFDSVSAYINAATTLGFAGDLVLRRVGFDQEEWDTDGRFDTTTQKGRWTPVKLGKYRVTANLAWSSSPAVNTRVIALLYKNGVAYKRIIFDYQAGVSDNDRIYHGTCLCEVTNAADYFEIFVNHNAGAGVTYNLRNGLVNGARFEAHYIGP